MRCPQCRSREDDRFCRSCLRNHNRKKRFATRDDAKETLNKILIDEPEDIYLKPYKCQVGATGEHWHLGHVRNTKMRKSIERRAEKKQRKALWKDKESV